MAGSVALLVGRLVIVVVLVLFRLIKASDGAADFWVALQVRHPVVDGPGIPEDPNRSSLCDRNIDGSKYELTRYPS